MKFTDIWGNKCKKSGYFKPVLSAAYSWDFQINKIWKRRSRTNTKSIYSHAGARMGLWWLILSRYFWKKIEKKIKNFFFFFFFFFQNFYWFSYTLSAIRDPCVALRAYRWIWYWSWTSFFRFCWFESPSYMLQIVLA